MGAALGLRLGRVFAPGLAGEGGAFGGAGAAFDLAVVNCESSEATLACAGEAGTSGASAGIPHCSGAPWGHAVSQQTWHSGRRHSGQEVQTSVKQCSVMHFWAMPPACDGTVAVSEEGVTTNAMLAIAR